MYLSDTEMKMEMSDYYVARMSTWDSIYRYPEGEPATIVTF